MSDAETEMLALLAELVQATKKMAAAFSEMSDRLDRSAQVSVHVNGQVPTPPIAWPTSISPAIGAKPRCGKCNMEMSDVMGYVCPNGGNCPTGLGGFTCTTTA